VNRNNRNYKNNPVFSIIPYFRKHNTLIIACVFVLKWIAHKREAGLLHCLYVFIGGVMGLKMRFLESAGIIHKISVRESFSRIQQKS